MILDGDGHAGPCWSLVGQVDSTYWDHQSGPIREVYLHSRGIVHRDLKPGALSWWGGGDFSCDGI